MNPNRYDLQESPREYPNDLECDPNDATFQPAKTYRAFTHGVPHPDLLVASDTEQPVDSLRYEIWINGCYFRSWMTRTLADQDKAHLLAEWQSHGITAPVQIEIKEQPCRHS